MFALQRPTEIIITIILVIVCLAAYVVPFELDKVDIPPMYEVRNSLVGVSTTKPKSLVQYLSQESAGKCVSEILRDKSNLLPAKKSPLLKQLLNKNHKKFKKRIDIFYVISDSLQSPITQTFLGKHGLTSFAIVLPKVTENEVNDKIEDCFCAKNNLVYQHMMDNGISKAIVLETDTIALSNMLKELKVAVKQATSMKKDQVEVMLLSGNFDTFTLGKQADEKSSHIINVSLDTGSLSSYLVAPQHHYVAHPAAYYITAKGAKKLVASMPTSLSLAELMLAKSEAKFRRLNMKWRIPAFFHRI